jgi:hypothetical protein
MDSLLIKLGLLAVALTLLGPALAWRLDVLTQAGVGLHQVVEAVR